MKTGEHGSVSVDWELTVAFATPFRYRLDQCDAGTFVCDGQEWNMRALKVPMVLELVSLLGVMYESAIMGPKIPNPDSLLFQFDVQVDGWRSRWSISLCLTW